MKKKNNTNGKTRIEVNNHLNFAVIVNYCLRRVVKIRLDDQHTAHKSSCDAYLVWDKFYNTLSCILLLKYEPLNQLVPIIVYKAPKHILHQDGKANCDNW
jgi:hypothetical protein